MIEIVDGQGRVIARVSRDNPSAWEWSRRDLAPESFQTMLAQDELLEREGGYKDGGYYTDVRELRQYTPEWLAAVLDRLWQWRLSWREVEGSEDEAATD